MTRDSWTATLLHPCMVEVHYWSFWYHSKTVLFLFLLEVINRPLLKTNCQMSQLLFYRNLNRVTKFIRTLLIKLMIVQLIRWKIIWSLFSCFCFTLKKASQLFWVDWSFQSFKFSQTQYKPNLLLIREFKNQYYKIWHTHKYPKCK